MILTVTLIVCALGGPAANGAVDPEQDPSCSLRQATVSDPDFSFGECIGAGGMHLKADYEHLHPGETVMRLRCSLGDARPRPEKSA